MIVCIFGLKYSYQYIGVNNRFRNSRYLANIINIQIVVILPSYPKKVGLAKPKGDAACWTVGVDKGKNS